MHFIGRAYRAHDPRWSFEPTSGKGAEITGGRFNVKGQAALYLALEAVTALAECTQGFANRMMPLTLCEYDIDCAEVADLTDEAAFKELKISEAALRCPWLQSQRSGKIAPSQAAANKLIKAGYVGAIVPCFVPGIHPGAKNLVLWKWGGDLPSKVTVYDPEGRLVGPP
jgi:RES domain-containing protein